MTQIKLNFNYEIYPSLTVPNGFLPSAKAAQACWFFYTRAQLQFETVGDSIDHQIILDNEMWMDKRYESLARTVAMIYSLESPAEFEVYWPAVRNQAKALGLPEPAPEYTNIKVGRIIT